MSIHRRWRTFWGKNHDYPVMAGPAAGLSAIRAAAAMEQFEAELAAKSENIRQHLEADVQRVLTERADNEAFERSLHRQHREEAFASDRHVHRDPTTGRFTKHL